MSGIDLLFTGLLDAFWSALAALGFAILFNVPRRWLVLCALLGALGHAVRKLLEEFGVPIEVGTLAGALMVGFIGYALGARFRIPSTIFTIPGTIPMVPGVFAYRTMITLLSVPNGTNAEVQVLLAEASVNAIKTALILAAISIGIAFPHLLFNREKPVV
jgi:uncharacterized membrane protein YjjB (DUF3815 family)